MKQETAASRRLDRSHGQIRRWYWRTRAHYGEGYHRMPWSQVFKELRMMSHRRKH